MKLHMFIRFCLLFTAADGSVQAAGHKESVLVNDANEVMLNIGKDRHGAVSKGEDSSASYSPTEIAATDDNFSLESVSDEDDKFIEVIDAERLIKTHVSDVDESIREEGSGDCDTGVAENDASFNKISKPSKPTDQQLTESVKRLQAIESDGVFKASLGQVIKSLHDIKGVSFNNVNEHAYNEDLNTVHNLADDGGFQGEIPDLDKPKKEKNYECSTNMKVRSAGESKNSSDDTSDGSEDSVRSTEETNDDENVTESSDKTTENKEENNSSAREMGFNHEQSNSSSNKIGFVEEERESSGDCEKEGLNSSEETSDDNEEGESSSEDTAKKEGESESSLEEARNDEEEKESSLEDTGDGEKESKSSLEETDDGEKESESSSKVSGDDEKESKSSSDETDDDEDESESSLAETGDDEKENESSSKESGDDEKENEISSEESDDDEKESESSSDETGDDEEESESSSDETGGDEEESKSFSDETGDDEEESESSSDETGDDEEKSKSSSDETGDDEEESESSSDETGDGEEESESSSDETGDDEEESKSSSEESDDDEKESGSSSDETDDDEKESESSSDETGDEEEESKSSSEETGDDEKESESSSEEPGAGEKEIVRSSQKVGCTKNGKTSSERTNEVDIEVNVDRPKDIDPVEKVAAQDDIIETTISTQENDKQTNVFSAYSEEHNSRIQFEQESSSGEGPSDAAMFEGNEDELGRIVMGHDAVKGDFPYMVYLDAFGRFCGGTLIDSYWVLTAAHCFRHRIGLRAFVGKHTLTDRTTGTVHLVDLLIRHPNFTLFHGASSDIALVRLATPASAPTIDVASNSSEHFAGHNCTIVGWGHRVGYAWSRVNTLQRYDGTVLSKFACYMYWKTKHINSLICIAGPGGSCNGDSGGPMICDNKLAGVTSFGFKYCLTVRPSVYTRVSEFYPWIEKMMTKYDPRKTHNIIV